MKVLAKITDRDVGGKAWKVRQHVRIAARAIVLKRNKIALMKVSKRGYYKLPGGGVKKGEIVKRGLMREIKEEVGSDIKIISELGEIVEYRTHEGLIQKSRAFIAESTKGGKPTFSKGEKKAGFKLEWMSIDRAIKLMKKSKPKLHSEKFIVKRDTLFLETAKRLLARK